MSLVPTFVMAVDGKFYENPTLRGEDSDGARWFLCFDDDDPPELVIETKGRRVNASHAVKILDNIGVKYKLLGGSPMVCGRCFTDDGFADGASFFFNLKSAIPIPKGFDSVIEGRPQRECVFYEFKGSAA